MKFLTIKKRGVRADGQKTSQVFYVEKNRRFGDILDQRTIRNSEDILIVGMHASGKTKYLDRLYERAAEVWKRKHPPVYISARAALADWLADKGVTLWWNSKLTETVDWKKLPSIEKIEAMQQYLSETRAILFIDNIQVLTGRKQEVVKDFIRNSSITVATTTDEGRIPAALRYEVLNRNPQMIRLASETAYDATHILFWLLILIFLGMGAFEIAFALGALGALGRGRGTTKQN